jgi:hypothetical protein
MARGGNKDKISRTVFNKVGDWPMRRANEWQQMRARKLQSSDTFDIGSANWSLALHRVCGI